jgi:hypothetical protein
MSSSSESRTDPVLSADLTHGSFTKSCSLIALRSIAETGSRAVQRPAGWIALVVSILFMTPAMGDPSGRDLILGSWDPGGGAFYDLPITVKPAVVILGACAPVRYNIIRDRPGHGPGHNLHPESDWREIAIELKPKTSAQAKCLRWLVIDFSIPRDMTRHAEVALARSRAEFEKEPGYIGWGTWGKDAP